MHVYGELHGTLTTQGRLQGSLVGDHHKIQGSLTIPNTPGLETYTGAYEVTPLPFEAQTLRTKNKLMGDDVVVLEIPYFETSNVSGTTVYIGGE